jgi:serine/threonine protein phosphatase 1
MTWIISDIHGCYYTLCGLLEAITKADRSPSFVFVGDYIDRGLHSSKVIDYLLKLKQQYDTTLLRGNHDDVVDYILNDHCSGSSSEWVVGPPTLDKIINWWMCNGLKQTIESYGVEAHLRDYGPYGNSLVANNSMANEFIKKVPDKHKSFLRGLVLYWENDTHFACHAYMRPDEELPRALKFMPADRNDETLWSRFQGNITEPGIETTIMPVWDKIGVFGHTPVQAYAESRMIKHHNIRLIDTGPHIEGGITGYCCDTDTSLFAGVVDEDIKV